MESSLSIGQILLEASLPVKTVMLVLLGCSFFSWLIIFGKIKDIKRANANADVFEEKFWSGIDLSGWFRELSAQSRLYGQAAIFVAGFESFARLCAVAKGHLEAVFTTSERAMQVSLSRELEGLEKGLPTLATIGSVSPYIGLLGTVWGIMSSFMALSDQAQVTLQVVAPDIAEALLATAMGLFAAIPAVIAYNRFATLIDGLAGRYEIFIGEFCGVLRRKAYESEFKEAA